MLHKEDKRLDLRKNNEMRLIEFHINYLDQAEGSCLVKMGKTWVMCTASIDEKVPHFLRNTGSGWITAEYGMLPRSTNTRVQREIGRGPSGRTQEIQRLIGRSLRAAVNLQELGERQIIIDCDVIQADGGTRTAAINGGYVALHLALRNLFQRRLVRRLPLLRHVAAISCGVVNGQALLDLNFIEDSNAEVDANFVYSSEDTLIEMQCTGEKNTFNTQQVLELLELSKKACIDIVAIQKKALNIS